MSTDSSFQYTVSTDGIIEAFLHTDESSDSVRVLYTDTAAISLARSRLSDAIGRTHSITEGDRLRKYLGTLEHDPDSILRMAQKNAS